MYYPDNSARWRLKPSQMSHHVDCYVVTDIVEECNVSNLRTNGQLDTKDGGTMALKHPLLFTSWQSIACHCAWMFISTVWKFQISQNLPDLYAQMPTDCEWHIPWAYFNNGNFHCWIHSKLENWCDLFMPSVQMKLLWSLPEHKLVAHMYSALSILAF